LDRIKIKSYSTILSGKEVGKFISIPDEFREIDLEVTLKPAIRKKNRFAKLLMNPIKVENISIPTKNEINER
jgi:hypothetical protein